MPSCIVDGEGLARAELGVSSRLRKRNDLWNRTETRPLSRKCLDRSVA